MAFIVKKNREIEIMYKENDDQFSLFFEFPLFVDQIGELIKMKEKVESKTAKELEEDEESSAMLLKVCSCLSRVEGIVDEDGNLFSVDSEVDRKLIFSFVLGKEGLLQKILVAYMGVDTKN